MHLSYFLCFAVLGVIVTAKNLKQDIHDTASNYLHPLYERRAANPAAVMKALKGIY